MISERFKDRPISALDNAIYWVEYVIRHKGAGYLRSWGADVPFYQYYLLDIGAIAIIALVSSVYLLYYLLVLIWNTFCCRRNNRKAKLS